MLFSLIAWCLTLFSSCVTAQANDFPTSIPARQAASSVGDCNTTCTNHRQLQANCTFAHCGCNVRFIQAQGECLLCQNSTPEDAAAVQFLLDSEMSECQSAGFTVQFQLDFDPATAALIHQFNHDSAFLRRSQTAFLGLQISGGHVGLFIVLAFSLFSRKVQRDLTFLNFCITWIFSSIVFSMLSVVSLLARGGGGRIISRDSPRLYRGGEGNNPANPLGTVAPNQCLAQAALTEGAQIMTACSTLALVIQLWLTLRATLYGVNSHGPKQSKWMTCALLFIPYILFIAFALPTVYVGTEHTVIKVIKLNPFLQAVYGVTLGILLITVVFDVLIIRVLYKHWWAFRRLETKSAISLSILLRVMVFSVYRIAVAAAFGTIVVRPPTLKAASQGESLVIFFGIPIWVDMLQAAIPLLGFLVLGINRDLICSLKFWRRFRAQNDTYNGRFTTVNV